MKTALLFAVLCCALLPQSSDGQQSADVANKICCWGGDDIRIPLKRLEYYYWTGSHCPLNHIVFVTKSQRHFCMNPDNERVQMAKKHMDKKSDLNSPK